MDPRFIATASLSYPDCPETDGPCTLVSVADKPLLGDDTCLPVLAPPMSLYPRSSIAPRLQIMEKNDPREFQPVKLGPREL